MRQPLRAWTQSLLETMQRLPGREQEREPLWDAEDGGRRVSMIRTEETRQVPSRVLRVMRRCETERGGLPLGEAQGALPLLPL